MANKTLFNALPIVALLIGWSGLSNAQEGDFYGTIDNVVDHLPTDPAPDRPYWCSEGVGFAPISSRNLTRYFLGRPDDFVRAQSLFDRQARMKTTDVVHRGRFLRFARQQAESWTPDQRAAWREVIAALDEQLVGLNISLPIVFISKTSGLEEFDFAYTRQRTVFFPERIANRAIDDPEGAYKLLAHEFFHIASRFDSNMREALFGLIGFHNVDNAEYPDEFRPMKITNPDAFRYEDAILVQTGPMQSEWVIPVTQAALPIEEFIELPTPLAGTAVPLMAVDIHTGSAVRDPIGNLVLYNFGNTNYVPLVLRNTDFIIDPEEIMADNFSLLMLRRKNGVAPLENNGIPVTDLALLDSIEHVLSAECRVGPAR